MVISLFNPCPSQYSTRLSEEMAKLKDVLLHSYHVLPYLSHVLVHLSYLYQNLIELLSNIGRCHVLYLIHFGGCGVHLRDYSSK